eukprot:scaffold5297_cov374-Prasinococcus_capsulatus_cf.AAC.15
MRCPPTYPAAARSPRPRRRGKIPGTSGSAPIVRGSRGTEGGPHWRLCGSRAALSYAPEPSREDGTSTPPIDPARSRASQPNSWPMRR